MEIYNNAFFDLDGTIINSEEGVLNSIRYALSFYNINNPDYQVLKKFIGPSLRESFKKYFNFDDEIIEDLIIKYRENYVNGDMFKVKIYNGIEELFKYLKSKNKKIYLATAKPEPFAIKIIEKLGLIQYFDYICGSSMDSSREHKHQVLSEIFKKFPEINKRESVMIGDKENDVIGAKTVGIDCIGVIYGFGSLEELENAKAKYIANDVLDLKKYF